MPRNGSGTYSIPTSFTAGTNIQSATMNGNFADVGAELTNSLSRDGQAGMTGQFKAASGTAAAPGISFGADTDTGFYRKSADTIGIVSAGTEIGVLSPAGLANAAGAKADHFPSGTAMLFAQTAAPTGWTKSTTHNNKALRLVSGAAGAGGASDFTAIFTDRTLTVDQLPSHTHTGPSHTHGFSGTTGSENANHTHTGNTDTAGAHDHNYSRPTGDGVAQGGGAVAAALVNAYTTLSTSSHAGHQHNVSLNIQSANHQHGFSGNTNADGTGATGATGSGATINFNVAYVDVILATKD
jgi:hypothetical protein